MKALLIAGTDTDVGKTVLTAALAAYWQTYRSDPLGLMKLLQTGEGDRQTYSQLFSDTSIQMSVPLQFKEPVAPPVAAAREGRSVDLAVVWQAFKALSQHQFVLVEALGGLGSPVTWELTVADLARDWRLPTVLVVPVKLGAIAAAVANVALARAAGVQVIGIVLNCSSAQAESKRADWTPVELIQSLTNVPILGTIPYLADPDAIAQLVQAASNLDIEELLPE
ncbi:MAG: dethiobiotin synthase [Cyanophyceae cyanobacterium]